MKVAIYARVSTDRQGTMNQIAELRGFCARKGWEIAGEYVDEDVRGKEPRKPQQEAMLRDAHQRRFDVVAFWALDRLTRGGVEDAIVLLHRLGRMGVDFVSFREDAITSMVPGPVRDMVLSIYAALAEMETNRLSERVKSGMRRAKESGKHVGRPEGKLDSDSHRIVPYPVSAAQIAAERAQGASWGSLARRYGIARASVRRLYRKGLAQDGEG